MMRIVFLTGSHPRHEFMARTLARCNILAGLVIERREDHLPQPLDALKSSTKILFQRHFSERSLAEKRFLGEDGSSGWLSNVDLLKVSREELNGSLVSSFLDRHKPKIVLSYGVHKLTMQTLRHIRDMGGSAWNIHGGLSPWYRGVITHFWPSYLLEPQMTGMTVHETSDALDGGAIIHQNVAELVRGDGIHDLACRAVLGLGREIPELMERAAKGAVKPPKLQLTTGRIWRDADWRPEHLHPIYDLYKNRIVDRWLDGDLAHNLPQLTRQF